MAYSPLLQFHLLTLVLLSKYQSLEIITFIDNSDQNLTVFTTNRTEPNFIYSPVSCCQKSNLHYELPHHSVTNFTIFKENESNEEFIPDNITASLIDKQHTVIPINTFSLESYPNIIQLQLFNVCLTESNSLSRVVAVSFQLNHIVHRFAYVKICELQSSFIIRFTMLFLLLGSMIGFVLLTSHFTHETALIIKQKGTISLFWWYGVILLILGVFIVVFIHFFNRFSLKLISFCVLFLLLGGVYKTSVSFFKILLHAQCISTKLKEFISKTNFSIKRYRIASVVISIGLAVLWICFHNWLLCNFLLFSMLLAVSQSFSFNSYPNLLLFQCCFMSYDVFWFFTQFYFGGFYSIRALEAIDQPIKLVMPKFIERDKLHPCYFISIVDLFTVFCLVKYSKCFDVIKGYSSYSYYKTSLVILSIGTILVFPIQLYLNNDQIHLFPIEMLLISGMIVKAALGNDFFDFWSGKNLQGMQKAVDDIISNESSGKISESNSITYNQYKNTDNHENSS